MDTLTCVYWAIAVNLGFLLATLVVESLYDIADPSSRRRLRDECRRHPRKCVFEQTQIVLLYAALALIGLAAEMAATPGWPWIFTLSFVSGSAFTVWRFRKYNG